MPDDAAFVRMIAATPDDDAPRLVYADYLEESGDPVKMARAEFIRVQVEKARLVPDTPKSNELWHRDTALLEWAREWRRELPAIEGVEYGGFVRGFIDHVTAHGDKLAHFFATIVDSVPLRKLSLDGNFSLASVRAITQSVNLEQVVELDISAHSLESPSILRQFTRRGPWPKLRHLRILWYQHGARDENAAWMQVWDEFRRAFGDSLRS